MNLSNTLILFDLVGTLIETAGGPAGVGSAYARMAARHGVAVDPSLLDAAFRAEFHPLRLGEGRAGRGADLVDRERAHWRLIVERVFARSGALDALAPEAFGRLFDDLFAHFASAAAWAPFPDAAPALDALERQGARLGLVTNFDSRVFALLESLGWRERFDPVVIPALAGASKPDPVIFKSALERAGVSAASAVYVGDLPEDDVEGALGAGIHPVLVDRGGRHRDRSGASRIGSLAELDALLAALTAGRVR